MNFCCNHVTITGLGANKNFGSIAAAFGGDYNMKIGAKYSTCVS
jgi:hypothetical protein